MEKLIAAIERTLNNDESEPPRSLQDDLLTLISYIRSLQSTITTQVEAIRAARETMQYVKELRQNPRWKTHGAALMEKVGFQAIQQALSRLSHLLP